MPTVRVSAKARREIEAVLRALPIAEPCISIRRSRPIANVTREADGTASWTRESVAPWSARLLSKRGLPPGELMEVEGILFHFDASASDPIPPLDILVVDGDIQVEIAS